MIYQEMIDFGYNTYKEYYENIQKLYSKRVRMGDNLKYCKFLLEIIKEKEELELLIEEIPKCESKYIEEFRMAVEDYFKSAKEIKSDMMELRLDEVINGLKSYFSEIKEFIEMEIELRNKTCEPKTMADYMKEDKKNLEPLSENPAELY